MLQKSKLRLSKKKASRRYREILGLLVLTLAAVLSFSFFYYLYYHPANYECSQSIGSVGCNLARRLVRDFGLSGSLLLAALFAGSYMMIFTTLKASVVLFRLVNYGFLFLCGMIFLSVVSKNGKSIVGELGHAARVASMDAWFGRETYASYAVALSLLIIALMLCFRVSLLSCGWFLANFGWLLWEVLRDGIFKPVLTSTVFVAQALAKLAQVFQKRMIGKIAELKERLSFYWKSRKKANVRKEQPSEASATAEPPTPEIPIPETTPEARVEAPAVEPKKRPARVPVQQKLPLPEDSSDYPLPPLYLLDSPVDNAAEIDRTTVDAGKFTLQKKLEDLGIKGKVVDPPQPGPIITMYRFDPDPGVKVRRIVTLADDLAMALKAFGVRVLAPIPGESVVGIEVPNPRREKVTIFLKEIIQSKTFQDAPSKLTLALGKKITGEPFVDDLARMPHLLVAGATGTGKSVSLNAMILSILFKATPSDVKFIMIDPKMLELAVYEDIPHLLVPVVTDPKKAASAFFWAMKEMDERYRLMRAKGARNIDHYNRMLDKETSKRKHAIELEETEDIPSDTLEMGGNLKGDLPLVHMRLARIVIIVDELADLMMTVRRDIEEHITRLAQKARAAGIHLIMATQRPSVDVITGLIKANFPARISFQVTSRVDSRTILDSIGAEKLLGNGDMLFLPPGTARLVRVHGAYVSDQEVRKVVEEIKKRGKAEYLHEILEAKKTTETSDADEIDDEMYDQALAFIAESQQASVSMVQRKFRIGYNRAARLIEKMEKEGVVGPAEGSKPREVYAKKVGAV
jgi:S-DNA-T family DNA segregation ATPase FtsK/SpoIIIE